MTRIRYFVYREGGEISKPYKMDAGDDLETAKKIYDFNFGEALKILTKQTIHTVEELVCRDGHV